MPPESLDAYWSLQPDKLMLLLGAAIALAVGLSPELLPAIFTVTLAQGSQKMARQGVIVKRLNAIENLGSMTVLCTDKTGTLTEGVVRLDAALDVDGKPWNRTPHRWDIHLIRSFMISFGLISTLFDFITFAALLYLVGESPALFRTGWFVESVLTELFILIIIRTYKPFYRSRPSRFLLISTLLVAVLTVALPYLPVGRLFSLVPLPPLVMLSICMITLLYILFSEASKRRFYHRFGFGP